LDNATGIDLPKEFDVATGNQIHLRMVPYANPDHPNGKQSANAHYVYGTAWNAVRYRLAAAFDYSREFGKSIAKNDAPPGQERFKQERDLFGCVTSALSAIECLYMAMYGAAAARELPSFPIDDPMHLFKYMKVERHNRRLIELAVAIYQGKLTWGKYNSYLVESAQLKKQETDELLASVAAARAEAAASAPPPTRRSMTAVEWFLLLQQQPTAPRPVNCSSFVNRQWISTTCF